MICLELNWLFYDPSWMLQLSEFVWTLRSSVWFGMSGYAKLFLTLVKDIQTHMLHKLQQKPWYQVQSYPYTYINTAVTKSGAYAGICPATGWGSAHNLFFLGPIGTWTLYKIIDFINQGVAKDPPPLVYDSAKNDIEFILVIRNKMLLILLPR